MSGLKQQLKENQSYLIVLSIYTFLFLSLCSKLSPVYPSNEWSDVNIYFTIGKALANGQSLYTDVFDPKGPLIFIIYGLGYMISNTTFIGVFLCFVAIWVLASITIYFLANDLLKNKELSLGISTLISFFALQYMHMGGSPEEIILLLHFFCVYTLLKANSNSLKSWHLCVFGTTCAVVLCLKFNLIVFFAFSVIAVFSQVFFLEDKRSFIQKVTWFLVGCGVVLLPLCIYLLATNSLWATIDTYILLNKQLAVTMPFDQLFRQGGKRVLEMFQYAPISASFIFIGAFIFPLLYLKEKSMKFFFVLGAISLYGIIFFAGVAHFYYPLPLYVFFPLGLISVVKLLSLYKLKPKPILAVLIVLLILSMSVLRTQFWGMSLDSIIRKEIPPGSNYAFADIINKEDAPTLLNLAYGDAVNIFTLCNIIPNIKYFSILNIPYHIYPTLHNEQIRYIAEKEIQFVVINEGNDLFGNLEVLQENYEIVAKYQGLEEYQNVKYPKTALLYKRKD